MGLSLIFRLDSNQEKQLLTVDKQEQLNLLFFFFLIGQGFVTSVSSSFILSFVFARIYCRNLKSTPKLETFSLSRITNAHTHKDLQMPP